MNQLTSLLQGFHFYVTTINIYLDGVGCNVFMALFHIFSVSLLKCKRSVKVRAEGSVSVCLCAKCGLPQTAGHSLIHNENIFIYLCIFLYFECKVPALPSRGIKTELVASKKSLYLCL